MLIEQVVEFELRGPVPPSRTCTLTTGYFLTKQKFLQKMFKWIIIYS